MAAKIKHEVYWKSDSNADIDNVLMTDVIQINIKQSIKPSSNYAEVLLKNSVKEILSDGTYVNEYVDDYKTLMFNEGDTLKIYAARLTQNRNIDTSTTSNDLIMTCDIEEINCKGDNKSSRIKLKTVDKTYSMLNKLWNYAYLAEDNWTAPLIIQDVIRKVCGMGDDFYQYDGSGNLVPNGGYAIDARMKSTGTTLLPAYIEDTRPDTSPFPVISMAKVFKSAYEFIQDCSTPENTNSSTAIAADNLICERNMIFYVDERNKFHWFYPKDAVTATLASTINSSVTTIPLTSIPTGMATDGRVQIDSELIDYTGISGTDLTGCTRGVNQSIAAAHSAGALVESAITIIEGNTTNGQELLSLDMTKKTFDIINMVIYNAGQDLYGSGILWYYYDTATKDKDLKMTYKPYTDIATNLITEEITKGNVYASTAGLFTFQETTYAATAYPITTSWGETVADDSAYNNAIRDHAAFDLDSVGAQYATRLTAKKGNPRWKGTVNLNGFRFRPGDSILLTSNRFGINRQQLRVNEVTHSITKDAWTTDLDTEEDESV